MIKGEYIHIRNLTQHDSKEKTTVASYNHICDDSSNYNPPSAGIRDMDKCGFNAHSVSLNFKFLVNRTSANLLC